jgi:hypothetical protein
VLRAAAAELAESCAPLVCTEGQPSAACHRLLTAARGRIRWRGDFDRTGLRTTAMAITRYEAIPWRMAATDYRAALETGDSEPLKGAPALSPWDPHLAAEMTEQGRAVMEERLIPTLLADLGVITHPVLPPFVMCLVRSALCARIEPVACRQVGHHACLGATGPALRGDVLALVRANRAGRFDH